MASKDKEKNREAFKRWYDNNKQTQIERVKKQQQKIADEIKQYKESIPCHDCETFYPHYIMDFDHTLDNKSGNVSTLMRRGSRKQVWEEIDKCELVCANCHRARTYNRR
jgi:NAD-dependent dihydropyrimidine dehydrogenase PreA subunit